MHQHQGNTLPDKKIKRGMDGGGATEATCLRHKERVFAVTGKKRFFLSIKAITVKKFGLILWRFVWRVMFVYNTRGCVQTAKKSSPPCVISHV